MRDGKDVGFSWKSTSQFHARHKLKNVDFRSRKEKMLIHIRAVFMSVEK